MPAKGRNDTFPSPALSAIARTCPRPLRGRRGRRSCCGATGWGARANGSVSPHPHPSPQEGAEPAMPGGERHEQDHAQQGPDGAEGHDRADQRLHQGVHLAGGPPRRARAVPRDRTVRRRGRDIVPRLRPLGPLHRRARHHRRRERPAAHPRGVGAANAAASRPTRAARSSPRTTATSRPSTSPATSPTSARRCAVCPASP